MTGNGAMERKYFKTNNRNSTSLLKEVPSFRSGVESLVNIPGQIRVIRYLKGNNMDDLRRDWRTVGNDIKKAMKHYDR